MASDRGELEEEDYREKENADRARISPALILHPLKPTKLWIITEADRSIGQLEFAERAIPIIQSLAILSLACFVADKRRRREPSQP